VLLCELSRFSSGFSSNGSYVANPFAFFDLCVKGTRIRRTFYFIEFSFLFWVLLQGRLRFSYLFVSCSQFSSCVRYLSFVFPCIMTCFQLDEFSYYGPVAFLCPPPPRYFRNSSSFFLSIVLPTKYRMVSCFLLPQGQTCPTFSF
jgi:hypothetical protein